MFLPLTILVHSMLSIYQTTQFNNDVYHSGLCNTAKNILWRTPKWALLWSSIFVCFWPENTHSSSFFTLNLNFFLWYSVCASFKTKIMVGLTIFILEREKITFFQWFWPHQFSPWPQNGPDLTFNLCSRSNCFWNTDAYKSLSLYNSNEGSCVAVCCICHILEQILLPPPHNSYLLQISNVFIHTQLQASVQT